MQVGVDGGPGTFSAEGDGICSGGVFTTVAFELATNAATFRDKYDCEDGSGSFFLIGEVDIATDLTSYTGTWEVEDASGSGDYQHTTGSGTLTGETEPEWVVKYEGQAIDSTPVIDRLTEQGVISRPICPTRPVAGGRRRPKPKRPVSEIVSDQRR